MRTVHVSLGNRSYAIKIAPGLIDRFGRECARLKLGARCAIITDTNVGKRYAKAVFNSLATAGFSPSLIIVQPGETAKSLKTVQSCYDQLAAHRLERKSFIVALGGGVVGDLAGFRRGDLFARHCLRAGADDPARAGGQLRRRQSRRQSEGREKPGRRVLPAAIGRCATSTRSRPCLTANSAPASPRSSNTASFTTPNCSRRSNATCRSCSSANRKCSRRSSRAAAKSRRRSSARTKPRAACARF